MKLKEPIWFLHTRYHDDFSQLGAGQDRFLSNWAIPSFIELLVSRPIPAGLSIFIAIDINLGDVVAVSLKRYRTHVKLKGSFTDTADSLVTKKLVALGVVRGHNTRGPVTQRPFG